jgi:hypothetical protein
MQDFDPMNPCEEFDMLGTMVCCHSRYILGHKQYKDGVEAIYETLQELNYDNYVKMDDDYCDMNYNDFIEKYMNKLDDIAIVLPLYLYDHSGITMNTTGFHCPWDSGQIGFIYVTKENIRKEFNKKRISLQLRHKVLNQLKGEVKLYDQYLTGDVYGYNIDDPYTGEHISSCWGFYGYDWESNGLMEMVKNAIDYQIKLNENKKAEAIAKEVGCACCI